MEIYTESDEEYYTKIASYGSKELNSEFNRWKKEYKAKHYKWTFGTDKNISADDLYFLCIEIHRDFLKNESSGNTNDAKVTVRNKKTTKKAKASAKLEKTKKTARTARKAKGK